MILWDAFFSAEVIKVLFHGNATMIIKYFLKIFILCTVPLAYILTYDARIVIIEILVCTHHTNARVCLIFTNEPRKRASDEYEYCVGII